MAVLAQVRPERLQTTKLEKEFLTVERITNSALAIRWLGFETIAECRSVTKVGANETPLTWEIVKANSIERIAEIMYDPAEKVFTISRGPGSGQGAKYTDIAKLGKLVVKAWLNREATLKVPHMLCPKHHKELMRRIAWPLNHASPNHYGYCPTCEKSIVAIPDNYNRYNASYTYAWF